MPEIIKNTTNSRLNPSDEYAELIDMYKIKHDQSEQMFNGRTLLKFTNIIKQFLILNNCKSVLDYGCGKAILYSDRFSEVTDEIDCPLPDYWELESYQLFDPAYEEHSKLPIHKKDAVICTDVLEHIAEEDLEWVIKEIFSYARKMVFLNVACFAAAKSLPDGRNAHISIFKPTDWLNLLADISKEFKHLKIYLFADTLEKEDSKTNFYTEGYRIDQYPRIAVLRHDQMDDLVPLKPSVVNRDKMNVKESQLKQGGKIL